MAQRQQDLFWFDFLLRVHNVLFATGLIAGFLCVVYGVGGQWISGAVTNAPHWIVFSDQYAAQAVGTGAGMSVKYWFIAVPLVYGSAIWMTKKIWY